ncbi:MAG: extracellular solute-binding protein, partial [Chloroflexi bacterium]|nr:extracellular solute-binding protein [Chloroflexota bacterium]
MSEKKGLTRRKVIRSGLIGGAGLAAVAALAGCGETQIVEKEVVRVVTQEVPVEKVVTQVVEKERVVEVEKVVTQQVEVAVEVEKVVTQQVEVEKVVTKIVEVEKPVVEKASLRLASYVWGDRVVAEYARNISDWEAKSGHNVQFEYSNYNGHLQRLATQIAAGNPPDVAMSVPDVIPNWVAAGIIVELTEYLKVSTFDINEWYPEVWQGLRDVSQPKTSPVPA